MLTWIQSFHLHEEYNNQDLRNGTNGSGKILKIQIYTPYIELLRKSWSI